MNEYSNSSAGWSREKSGQNCAHLFAVYSERERTAPPRPKHRFSDSKHLRLAQKFISAAANTRQSLVAPACPEPRRASCRRFFAQPLRSTFASSLRPARRSTRSILIATPKRLEFAISPTKQTSRPISNRVKITGYCEALLEFSSVAPACPASRRASCRRISAPFTSRKIAVRMLVLRRTRSSFLTGPPKQLEITVIHRKQTLESVSNRDTNSRSAVARLDRFSVACRLPTGHSLTRLDADASFPRLPIARKTNP
jgi:hypothetical protein